MVEMHRALEIGPADTAAIVMQEALSAGVSRETLLRLRNSCNRDIYAETCKAHAYIPGYTPLTKRCQQDGCTLQWYPSYEDLVSGKATVVMTLAEAAVTARQADWMIMRYRTRGGRLKSVCYCPVHAHPEKWKFSGYDYNGRCWTCGAEASEDDEFDGTKEYVKEWCRDHYCEPDTNMTQLGEREIVPVEEGEEEA